MTKNVERTEASEKLRKALKGMVVAMTTPFNKDYTLDIKGLKELTKFYVKSGVPSVIAAGSTGEFHALTDEERKLVIRTVVEESEGKMNVVGCAAHSGTDMALKLTQYCEEIGCDGVMVTPPYYSFTGYEGLKKHIQTISDNSDIGIVVYFSGSVLRFPAIKNIATDHLTCPDEMLEIAKIPNVGAFKDASSDYGFHRDVSIALGGDDGLISVMSSGGMTFHYWGHQFGANCCLTGIGNIWPEIELDFNEKLRTGDRKGALEIVKTKDLDYLHTTASTGKYWACVKYMLDLVGLPGGPMRLPNIDVTEDEKRSIDAMLKRTGLLD